MPVTRVISRVTLQGILAGGLPEECILNNCKVAAFEDDDTRVTAVLEDGRRIQGDVLIGADGACAWPLRAAALRCGGFATARTFADGHAARALRSAGIWSKVRTQMLGKSEPAYSNYTVRRMRACCALRHATSSAQSFSKYLHPAYRCLCP